jgi:chromosome segregation ATPase
MASLAPAMHSQQYQQALHTAALELKYANNSHMVDILEKVEDLRRSRFTVNCLEDSTDDLREQLQYEEDRADTFERLVNENLVRAEAAEAGLAECEADLRTRENEIAALNAEAQALRDAREDTTAVLTEKLALARELSVLKPELEHLKLQAATVEQLTVDKLDLQHQLTNAQCEVEKAKREAQRALAKRRNTVFEIAQEEQVDDLKRQLQKEKRARERAEEALQNAQSDMDSEDILKQLAKEKKMREKAEEELEAARENTQIEDVRKDLLKEKKAKQRLEDVVENLQGEIEKAEKAAARALKRADGNASADDQAEELRQELAKEKKDRQRAEKNGEHAAEEAETQRAALEDRLGRFREKLRSTKDRLKEMETELAAAKEAAEIANAAAASIAAAAATAPTKAATKTDAPKAAKPTKKRAAAAMEPEESALGTPGDGPGAKKRGRKGRSAGVGDKSTFSITPFLNKTMSADVEEQSEAEEEASPVAQKISKQPLAPAESSKANAQTKKPTSRKPKPPMLEMVTEESEDVHSQGQENAPKTKAAGMKLKTKTTDGPDETREPIKKKKPRKSLVEFDTFRASEEKSTTMQKKKRKLGGMGKTLMDEEDDSQAPAKGGFGARGLFGTKGYSVLAGQKKNSSMFGKSSGLGKSVLLSAADGSGFQFSPLKRSRKNLDDTLRG